METRFAPAAKTDFKAIVRYIGEHNIGAASEFRARIMKTCSMLLANPAAGLLRPEVGAEIRSFPVGKYILYYRQTGFGILVIRLLHGARDHLRLLRNDKSMT